MPHLKFNHVFTALMVLSFLSAFALPRVMTDRVQGSVQNLFAPVAAPSRGIVSWTLKKLLPNRIRDDGSPATPRTSSEVYDENDRLRVQIGHLTAQVQRLEEREQAERATLGSLRDLCTHFNVMGTDPGPRKMLMLQASSFDAVREGMTVLYAGGLAGRIVRVTAGGVQVQLITDKYSKVAAVFARFVPRADGTVVFQTMAGSPRLVKGTGTDQMIIEDVPESAVTESDVRLNDWLVMSDADWPRELNGLRVGRVVSITPSRTPTFFNIGVQADQTLSKLDEVMVMNKEKK